MQFFFISFFFNDNEVSHKTVNFTKRKKLKTEKLEKI